MKQIGIVLTMADPCQIANPGNGNRCQQAAGAKGMHKGSGFVSDGHGIL